MNPVLAQIPNRILRLAIGALTQANTHAVFSDPGNEHWDFISITNAAHAGELFLKAVIAKEHPLLIFRDLFSLDDSKSDLLDIDSLIRRGRTHDFDKLPQIFWAATGKRVPNIECFDRLRKARNSIQHFCAPDQEDFRGLSLEFIYTIIDPIIHREFNLYAIDYHEDHHIGYDYVVGCLLRREIKFTMPEDFDVGEIRIAEELKGAGTSYKRWVSRQLKRIGRDDLLM